MHYASIRAGKRTPRVRLAGVISLALSAVGIQEIYALLNPEKLAYLQKQFSRRRAQL
jgi:hypothetical protein